MLYIKNEFLNPYYNLALEEYALKEVAPAENIIMLWQNEPSVIIGRFQNTIAEVNGDYVSEHGVNVVRRITGGGAVYHDLGNLNFTFIEKQGSEGLDFSRFTEPIVQALRKLGVEAEHSGRNDITILGKKFSGNAQYNYRGRTLHHGTILYDSNLENVQAALNVKADKIESKGVKSVRSRVTNISDYLTEKRSVLEFRDVLLHYLFAGKEVSEYQLTTDDIAKVNCLQQEKYQTWDWNYGQSPPFNTVKVERFPWGGIEIRLFVEKGLIKECSIYGDFFSNEDLGELVALIRGIKYEESEIRRALLGKDLSKYFGQVTLEELLALFF